MKRVLLFLPIAFVLSCTSPDIPKAAKGIIGYWELDNLVVANNGQVVTVRDGEQLEYEYHKDGTYTMFLNFNEPVTQGVIWFDDETLELEGHTGYHKILHITKERLIYEAYTPSNELWRTYNFKRK